MMADIPPVRTKTDPYIALRFPEFRSYIAMRFLFTFAYQIQAVVVGWYIYQLTKDPLSLGLIGLAEAIPSITVTLYGGYVADKSNKKTMLIKIMATMFICSSVLAFVTSQAALEILSQGMIITVMYLMIFCIGLGRGFYSPTAFSIMGQIIPKEHYPNSSTWNSGAYQLGSIVGPAAGGLLYGFGGITSCFVVIVSFITMSLTCIIFFIKSHPVKFIPKKAYTKVLKKESDSCLKAGCS